MDEFVCTCHQKHEPTERCIRRPPSIKQKDEPTEIEMLQIILFSNPPVHKTWIIDMKLSDEPAE